MSQKNKKSKGGRKPIADKKERVLIFVEQSKIKAKGGIEKMKQHLYSCAG